MIMTKDITTIDSGQGPSFSVVGNNYRIFISGEQTGGSYAVIDMLVPPPGPHHDATSFLDIITVINN